MLDRSYFGKSPENLIDEKGWLVLCEPNPEEAELLVALGVDPDSVTVGHKGKHNFLLLRRYTEATVKFLKDITSS